MENLKNIFNNPVKYLTTLLKWCIVSSLVGIIGGTIGSIFHLSIDYVTELRGEWSWLIYLLPVGGLIITFLYSLSEKYGAMDTNRVFEAVKTDEKVPFVMAPLIFISTVITHLLGGSAGREGAALQLGGSIGGTVGKAFRLNNKDMHIVVMAGMSGVFAALFGTPVTAIIFAIEVVAVGVMYTAALVPCAISALVASQIALAFGLSPVKFADVIFPAISYGVVLKTALLAVLCALVSILFCVSIKKCEHLMERYIPNKYIRTVTGGALIILLTVISGCSDYNGAGMNIITNAIAGNAKPEAFLLKILFTAITISAGFKGGEIVPAFFIGSTFGCFAGGLLGLEAGYAAAVGFVAVFCGVVNCPIASAMLAMEVFGGNSMLLFVLVCGLSYMMSGYFSLYKSQKIIYSKLEDKLINSSTH